MPAIGYGTWVNVGKNGRLLLEDKPKLVEAMSHAIDVGYRHLDTAHLYQTEPEVGWVVRKKIQEGVITREQVFITTKVWQHNHRPEDVEASVRGSLERMGLDYVDLVLMHWPMSISLNINLGQKDLVSYCKKNGIQCVAYTPFGSMMPNREDPNNQGTKYERGLVAIPKTLTKSRVVENASIFDFKLDASDVKTLDSLDNGYRTVRPLFWQDYEYYPFDRIDAPVPKLPEIFLKWEDGGKIDI
ncbi:unnamed protein product [Danaus chrysippus]|uniref:(African queen) hypothetical protein n=1 Tax=Danaus chrysippus TaxID=151541 RepID=A0A8J2QYZ8_9NEOP|nr:unnamed protein product [Danaus chrysippus]